jgi:hypothetical protein
VFVDDTGRRRILTRRAGRIVVLGFTGYLGLVALGFARDPGVGPVHLPTFGLPSLGLVVPPAPAVPEAQATPTAGDGEQANGPQAPAESPATTPGTPVVRGTTTPRPTAPRSTGGPTASRAMAPNTGLPASDTSTTTSPSRPTSTSTPTTTSTTSSTAPTTTSTLPGQGQGQAPAQRSDAASTRGPDASGPPGQERKTTTTTGG